MLKLVNWLDGKILKLFEKFSHWFQKLTGRNNFFLARVFILAAAACNFVGVYDLVFPVLVKHNGKLFILSAACITTLLFLDSLTCDKLEKDAWSSTRVLRSFALAPSDPHSLFASVVRVIFLALSIDQLVKGVWQSLGSRYAIFEILFKAYLLMVTIYFYFLTVNPLPPSKSKIRQLVEKIFFKSDRTFSNQEQL